MTSRFDQYHTLLRFFNRGVRSVKRLVAYAIFVSILQLASAGLASAQGQYLGEVRLFGSNFCPAGWLPADGRLMQINQNEALYSLLGTIYGGNGIQTFGLPDLRGRAPYGTGSPGEPLGAIYGYLTQGGSRYGTALAMNWCIATAGIFPTRGTEPARVIDNQTRAADAVAPPNLYIAASFCPSGSQRSQKSFTDIFGSIFQGQSAISENPTFLNACLDSAAENDVRYLAQVFRSNSPASCDGYSVPADGRLMSIMQNTALFSLLGTTWGGDGKATFALPNLKLRTDQSGNIFCIVVQGRYPPRPGL